MKQGNIIFGHNFGNPAIVWVPCFAALLLLRTVRLHTLYYVDSSCSNACVRNFHLFSYLFFFWLFWFMVVHVVPWWFLIVSDGLFRLGGGSLYLNLLVCLGFLMQFNLVYGS